MMTHELCALVGHDLAATAENTDTTFWLVPPSVCVRCRCEFEGVRGIPPAARKRDGAFLSGSGAKKAEHA